MMHPANLVGNVRLLSGWSVDGEPRFYANLVLVASGDRDISAPPSSAEAAARVFPNGACAHLGNTGYSTQIETPEKVRELLSTMSR